MFICHKRTTELFDKLQHVAAVDGREAMLWQGGLKGKVEECSQDHKGFQRIVIELCQRADRVIAGDKRMADCNFIKAGVIERHTEIVEKKGAKSAIIEHQCFQAIEEHIALMQITMNQPKGCLAFVQPVPTWR